MSEDTLRTIGNEIYFFGEVDEKSAMELNILLRKMERQWFSHIVLYIHSTGGDAYAGFSVMDHIDALSIPVHTVADGLCCSAATLILLAGKKRMMKKHARVMIHQVSSSADATKHSDIRDEMKHLDGLMDQMRSVYIDRTKLHMKRLKTMMKRDVYLDVNQCLKYGIIDSIF
jgi:ATP-dependent Clp endopeptidase proteolytic subunit ClpP